MIYPPEFSVIVDESTIDYSNDKTSLSLNSNDPNVMLYINRKDRNGKEIYENDIIHFVSSRDQIDCYAVIEYNERDSAFEMVVYSKRKYSMDFLGYYGYYEVVGNIFENPELKVNI